MKRLAVAIGVLALAGTLAGSAQQIPQSVPESSQGAVYRVPEWPQYPALLAPGPGQDKVTQNCAVCHGLTYITSQPPLPAKAWAGEVKKMISVYGAQIAPSDAEQIVAYLRAHYTPQTIAHSYQTSATPVPLGGGGGREPAGGDVYAARCAACHQPDQQGVPGVFPPLAGRTGRLVARPAGRRYLIDAVLYGLHGSIESGGHRYHNTMPAWGEVLSDDQVAAVLSFVSHGRVTAADVATARATPRTPDQVRAERDEAGP